MKCTYLLHFLFWQMHILRIYFHQKWRENLFPPWKARLKDVNPQWGSYDSSFEFGKPAGESWHTNMGTELRDKNNCESIVVISGFFFFFSVHKPVNSYICLNYFELFFFYLYLVLTNTYHLSLLSKVLWV